MKKILISLMVLIVGLVFTPNSVFADSVVENVLIPSEGSCILNGVTISQLDDNQYMLDGTANDIGYFGFNPGNFTCSSTKGDLFIGIDGYFKEEIEKFTSIGFNVTYNSGSFTPTIADKDYLKFYYYKKITDNTIYSVESIEVREDFTYSEVISTDIHEAFFGMLFLDGEVFDNYTFSLMVHNDENGSPYVAHDGTATPDVPSTSLNIMEHSEFETITATNIKGIMNVDSFTLSPNTEYVISINDTSIVSGDNLNINISTCEDSSSSCERPSRSTVSDTTLYMNTTIDGLPTKYVSFTTNDNLHYYIEISSDVVDSEFIDFYSTYGIGHDNVGFNFELGAVPTAPPSFEDDVIVAPTYTVTDEYTLNREILSINDYNFTWSSEVREYTGAVDYDTTYILDGLTVYQKDLGNNEIEFIYYIDETVFATNETNTYFHTFFGEANGTPSSDEMNFDYNYKGGKPIWVAVTIGNIIYDNEYHVRFNCSSGANQEYAYYSDYNNQELITFVDPETENKPVINGYTGALVSQQSTPITIEYIQGLLTASDNADGDLTSSITITSDDYTANNDVLGEHEIVFTVEDSSGNSTSITVVVVVVDVERPVITYVGQSVYDLEIGSSSAAVMAEFLPVVTITDNIDTNLVAVVSSDFDYQVLGTYTVTYSVTDSNGNEAIPVVVTLNVIDTVAPVVTLIGPDSINIEFGENYTELGSTCLDRDISCVTVIDHEINVGVLGDYVVSYFYQDISGNLGSVERTVHVVDTTEPTISGNDQITYVVGTALSSADVISTFTVFDRFDGDLTSSIVVSGNNYDGNEDVPGSYEITLSVTDSNGNVASKLISITVEDNTPPIFSVSAQFMTLEEANAMTLADLYAYFGIE